MASSRKSLEPICFSPAIIVPDSTFESSTFCVWAVVESGPYKMEATTLLKHHHHEEDSALISQVDERRNVHPKESHFVSLQELCESSWVLAVVATILAAMADQQKADHGYLSKDPCAISLLCLQGVCGAALVAGIKTVPAYNGLNLIAHPVATIRLALALTLPTLILAYTLLYIFSARPRPVWRCVGSGLLSLPVGTVVAALLALAFGAPTSLQYASRTLHWACLMSVLVVLPAAIVLGSSWPDWQRMFASTRPRGGLERAVCIPAHGALIGAWVGAFPMPLDWERAWQEWPISCTYGATGGYLVGLTISVLLQFLHRKDIRSKVD